MCDFASWWAYIKQKNKDKIFTKLLNKKSINKQKFQQQKTKKITYKINNWIELMFLFILPLRRRNFNVLFWLEAARHKLQYRTACSLLKFRMEWATSGPRLREVVEQIQLMDIQFISGSTGGVPYWMAYFWSRLQKSLSTELNIHVISKYTIWIIRY